MRHVVGSEQIDMDMWTAVHTTRYHDVSHLCIYTQLHAIIVPAACYKCYETVRGGRVERVGVRTRGRYNWRV
jgi:hypothetical protein